MMKHFIKNKLGENSWILICYRKCKNVCLYLKRFRYIYIVRKYLRMGGVKSFVSSNCFAGRLYQDFDMEYTSPTVGLWFLPADYVEFCKKMPYFLNSEIIWTECSKTEIGNLNREKAEHYYPMGLIDGKIEVHFLHYDSCIEAWKKWKRRAKRIDYEHAFFIGMDQNGCTEADIKAFDALPFRKKVFFSSKPVEGDSVIFIPEFQAQGYVGDPYQKAHIFYRYLSKWLKEHEVLYS